MPSVLPISLPLRVDLEPLLAQDASYFAASASIVSFCSIEDLVSDGILNPFLNVVFLMEDFVHEGEHLNIITDSRSMSL